MKRIFLIILVVLLFALSAKPQQMARKLLFGTGALVNTPYITSTNDFDMSSLTKTPSVTLASGAAEGDLIFIWISTSTNTTITTPTGYTEIYKVSGNATYNSFALYYKVATSGDLGASTTVNLGTESYGNLSKISVHGKSTSPYFSTVTASNYYSTNGTSLSTSTSGGIASAFILAFSDTYFTSSSSVTISGGYTFLTGVNLANVEYVSNESKTQAATGTMEVFTVTAATTGKIQILQIQVLPY